MPPKPPFPLPRPTHFLCLPLITPSSRPRLQSTLSVFKSDVSDPSPSPSPSTSTPPSPSLSPHTSKKLHIPEKAIRPPGTLHLTISVLNLDTSEKLNGAIKILNSIFDDEISPGEKELNSLRTLLPLPPITLKSLYSMHTPHSTSILYTIPSTNDPSKPSKHLQTFSEQLKEKFTKAGFVLPERGGRERDLLLHATIVNTIYVSRGVERQERRERRDVRGGEGEEGARKSHTEAEAETENKNKNKNTNAQITKQTANPLPERDPHKNNQRTTRPSKHKARLTFDARDILSRYVDFTWMRDVRIEKVAICRMGAKKRGDGDEEYEVEAEIDVPFPISYLIPRISKSLLVFWYTINVHHHR